MEIRAAAAGDVVDLAALHVRGWQVGYRGLLPQDVLDRLDPAPRVERWTRAIVAADLPRTGTLVAADGDRLLGFAQLCPSRDSATDSVGEVASFYVDPAHWRRGVGRRLMDATVGTLAEAGWSEATLRVLDANARAIGFYTALGWRPDGATRTDTIGGRTVGEIRLRHGLRRTR